MEEISLHFFFLQPSLVFKKILGEVKASCHFPKVYYMIVKGLWLFNTNLMSPVKYGRKHEVR